MYASRIAAIPAAFFRPARRDRFQRGSDVISACSCTSLSTSLIEGGPTTVAAVPLLLQLLLLSALLLLLPLLPSSLLLLPPSLLTLLLLPPSLCCRCCCHQAATQHFLHVCNKLPDAAA